MARSTWRLTVDFVESVRRPGKYGDGFGLHLRVEPTGRRYWEQRLTVGGRRRTFGLGPYPVVTLRDARDAAMGNYLVAADGGDPAPPPRACSVPTLRQAAEATIEHLRPRWSASGSTERNWRRSLERHVFPLLGAKPVCDVKTRDLLLVLTPMWHKTPELALQVRFRLGAVMKWSVAHGHRCDNPAGAPLSTVLPRSAAPTRHYRALPHAEVAGAVRVVRATAATPSTKLLLEFIILTAARTGAARNACWPEIDIESAMWAVPALRMKGRKARKTRVDHRVPLSDAALSVLRQARVLCSGSGLIFPGSSGAPLSNMTALKLLRTSGIACVTHGFRSSFRDWCGETGVAREVAELCLAHRIAGSVEGAYARSDLYDRRKPVMQAWGVYVTAGAGPD